MEASGIAGAERADVGTGLTYTAEDFVAGQRLYARMGPRAALVVLCWMALLCGALCYSADNGLARLLLCGCVVLGAAASGALFRYGYLPLIARRHFAKYPRAQVEHTFALTPGGLRVRTDSSDAQLAWGDFIGWRGNEETTILYLAPRMFLILPARLAPLGFPYAELRAALERYGVKRRA